MADIKYYDVILKPVITEKSMNAMADATIAFESARPMSFMLSMLIP